VLGFLAFVAVVSPHNPFHGGVQLREVPSTGIVSERGWYFDHLTLLANLRQPKYQSYGWWREGQALRKSENRVAVHTNVGLFGFAAGPDRHVVDMAGLTDPLLARIRFEYRSDWRSGHFGRPIPAGYLETLRSGRNVIKDPELRALYDRLRLVVRGPIGSWSRLAAIPWFIFVRHERPPAAGSRG
jgi:arabinofuranosyltransferase